jgi:hypothetical protein
MNGLKLVRSKLWQGKNLHFLALGSDQLTAPVASYLLGTMPIVDKGYRIAVFVY